MENIHFGSCIGKGHCWQICLFVCWSISFPVCGIVSRRLSRIVCMFWFLMVFGSGCYVKVSSASIVFLCFLSIKKSNSFQNRGPSHPKIIIFNTWWVILALSSCLNAFSQRQHLHTLCVLPGSSFSGSTADVLTPTASAFSLNFSRCTAVQLVRSGDCWQLLAEIIINLSTQQCQVTANVFYSGQSDINNSCQHLSKQENAQWDPLGVTSCELELRLDSVQWI